MKKLNCAAAIASLVVASASSAMPVEHTNASSLTLSAEVVKASDQSLAVDLNGFELALVVSPQQQQQQQQQQQRQVAGLEAGTFGPSVNGFDV